MKSLISKRLKREFYNRDTIQVAHDLLGHYLVHIKQGVELVGKIVEVEAYLGIHDLAAHASKGITPRTKVMFGPPGYAYVYLIYGMYYCINVVTEPTGSGTAVLLRALEPVHNLEGMRTAGPGLLCRAMQIDKSLNEHDLTSDHLFIAAAPLLSQHEIVAAPRIGVDYAKEWAKKPLRFYIKNNPYVSKK